MHQTQRTSRAASPGRPGWWLVAILLAPQAARAQTPAEWRLAPPVFEVGGVAAGPEAEFANLGGVTLLDNGNVVIADRVDPFLKVFDPTGRHLRDLAHKGEGPGEYQYVLSLDWCAPGELSVFDVDRRIHRYTGDMELVGTRSVTLEAIPGGAAYQQDCHPNGYHVVTGWGDLQRQFKVGLYEATAPVVLLRDQVVVKDFGERLSSQRLGLVGPDGAPTGSAPHPFGRATVVALGSEKVYLGDARDYAIEVYDLSGGALPPIVWDGPPLRYDRALVDRLAEQAIAAAPERSRARLRRSYRELPDLDQLPAYDRILVSDEDEVWVRQFVRPDAVGEDWMVFDAAHALVGRLRLPPRSTLWEVREGNAVYSILDEFDVPVVRVSRIER
ncbi:MAG: hypothetical protein KC645_05675 [Gemmatimonadetes bacterium]|nr:hypothetical protein [Gemmatimonadota bacterium]